MAPSSSEVRTGCGQWPILVGLALWLAGVPLGVMTILAALSGRPPELLVEAGLVAPGSPVFPAWAAGLLAVLLTLALHLIVFVPAYRATRQPGHEFLNVTAALLIGVALYLALVAVARLPWPADSSDPLARNEARTAALELAVGLPLLLLGIGWFEARQEGSSLRKAWRVLGLRRWAATSAFWLALAAGALAVWPWVLAGSLGSTGTTAANVIQALPNALGQEFLFRGIALTWLWRASRNRTWGAAGSLLFFIAAQGASVLPNGDLGGIVRFVSALFLGLLFTELTVRAGGSIWPAVVAHFLYDWFHLAFVDPRSEVEILHGVARVWAVAASGMIGLLFWLGRKMAESGRSVRSHSFPLPPPSRLVASPAVPVSRPGRARTGSVLAGVTALSLWLIVAVLYLTLGAPGFHPDGFLIFMEEQADLTPAAGISDPVERRAWVYRTLVETAERSQAPLRAELDRRGVSYRPHYLINAIEVLDRPGLRRRFDRQPGVASVLFQPTVRPYPYSLPQPGVDPSGAAGVEWNVRGVGADRVWEAGYTGEGIIVGSADTGVAWEHPALREAYLGWDAARGEADHNYHWLDPWDRRPEPWDDGGHGTHTTGTVLGEDGANQIGVAPGARWIACRNMRHGIGNPGSYLSCMEFLFAPFPLGGDPFHDGDPARGAHIVNNSWGCPEREGCRPGTLQAAVDNLRAAGQMMVVSAGNEGPACSTVADPPALYDSAFTVGATDESDQITSFSSRGPVTVDGSTRVKPDVVAPGWLIRSAVPGGYTVNVGTSMAGPHVAGAVALLWSLEPALIGDIDRTETLLVETAQQLTPDLACPSGAEPGIVCACGQAPDVVPNNVYGWGEIDVWAAAQRVLSGR